MTRKGSHLSGAVVPCGVPYAGTLVLGLGLLALVVGCLDPPESRELSITVEAMRSTVATGDSVDIHVEAEGPRLIQVDVTFGDGREENLTPGGSVEVTAQLVHAYDSVGTYTVAGLAEDMDGVQTTDNAFIEVVEDGD